ncbi:hypothetical protein BDR04DRAFT_1185567, partial [Suillus decipiens]
RLWESAECTTRKDSGIGVAVLALLRSKTNAFPLLMVIIEQYHPPLDNINSPAGLIDAGETAEAAAIRELKTGYKADMTEPEYSPIVVGDPGMTNANMKLMVDYHMCNNQTSDI